jgi:hypothetical protein
VLLEKLEKYLILLHQFLLCLQLKYLHLLLLHHRHHLK